MALSEKSRSHLYQALTQLVDEEAVSEMLTHFPTRGDAEPVTREHLDRRLAELRSELHAELAGVRTEISDLRGELRTEIAGLRGELHTEIAGLRGELGAEISGLRGELHAEIAASANRVIVWVGGTIVATAGVALALADRLAS